MASTQASQYDRVDGRPFYLEEVNIQEPSNDVKFEKVIVEPSLGTTNLGPITEIVNFKDDDNHSEVPTENFNDTIDALRSSSGNAMRSLKNLKYRDSTNFTSYSDEESIDSNCSKFNENPCVIEDFVRNFLLRNCMFRALECFQSEWFEKKCTTENSEVGITSDVELVPDVYAKNELLNDKVVNLSRDNDKIKAELRKLREDYNKLAKERDFHRMHHRRTTQDKDKLLNDIKKQTVHYQNYEPTLRDLRRKYESAMKEKMLASLERDRAVAHLNNLMVNQKFKSCSPIKDDKDLGTGFREDRESGKVGPTQHSLAMARHDQEEFDKGNKSKNFNENVSIYNPKDSDWPADRRVNPTLSKIKNLPKFNYSSLKVDVKVDVSELPLSSIALHPTKEIAVTGCDDSTWYLWSVPSYKSRHEAALEEDSNSNFFINKSSQTIDKESTDSRENKISPAQLLMSGTGHSDWISTVDFHPSGNILATGAGDATVRVWNLETQKQEISFNDHQNAIWGVSFHSSGNFLASCSMDTTAKIWDLNSQRCRTTLRGHYDSINTLEFLDYSNTLLTGSADKTLKLWDARTHLCAHTYIGHAQSINNASFSKRGDKIVSTDSFGVVNIWDVRNARTEVKRIDLGLQAGNCVKYHPTGDYIVVACADNQIRVLKSPDLLDDEDLGNFKNKKIDNSEIFSLSYNNGHEDSVNGLVFGHDGQALFSCGSDGTMRIWR